jgi:hypothetical protein
MFYQNALFTVILHESFFVEDKLIHGIFASKVLAKDIGFWIAREFIPLKFGELGYAR